MRLHVENMTCAHCERTSRKAIAALSPPAKVDIDLPSKTVEIDGTVSAPQIVMALADEGYSAVQLSEIA